MSPVVRATRRGEHRWKLDETNGDTAADSGRTLAPVQGARANAERLGFAWGFKASDEAYVSFPGLSFATRGVSVTAFVVLTNDTAVAADTWALFDFRGAGGSTRLRLRSTRGVAEVAEKSVQRLLE